MSTKTIDTLSVGDIQAHPVWKFSTVEVMAIEPVMGVPCTTLNGRLVGTRVKLADGSTMWALLGNIDTDNPALSEHFLTLSIELNGSWFHLARYHDYDHEQRGPAHLARWLGKSLEHIFPIVYDIRNVYRGDSAILTGRFEKEPRERLTRAEIIALAVP